MLDITTRRARSSDAETLTAIAFKAKAHWGYDHNFMQQCKDELTVTAGDIANPDSSYWVAEADGVIAGFSALNQQGEWLELEALFVSPEQMGKGIGTRLFREAVARARALDGQVLQIQSDPNASAFYRTMGCDYVGETASQCIPNRCLPHWQLIL